MSETCDYLTQPGNVPCGAPATHSYVNPRGRFYVCPDHCTAVYRATKKKTNPTPLVTTVLDEKKDTHVARAVDQAIAEAAAQPRPVYNPVIPAMQPGKSLSQLYAEMQQSQSEGSDLL